MHFRSTSGMVVLRKVLLVHSQYNPVLAVHLTAFQPPSFLKMTSHTLLKWDRLTVAVLQCQNHLLWVVKAKWANNQHFSLQIRAVV